VGAEVSVRLPTGAARQFPRLFEELDSRLQELGLEHYGLSMVTMEEVFLRIAHAAEVQNAKELDDAAANEGTAKLSSKKISTTSASIEA